MALPRKVLMKKAQRLESKELRKNKIAPEHLSDLDGLLDDVYKTSRPTSADYTNRVGLIYAFNAMAKEIYGKSECPVVEGFGSFIMDMFSSRSDLDLSINFKNTASGCPREKRIQILKKFTKKLYILKRKGHVSNIQTIMHARVPIVKVMDIGTKIECDLSVHNLDGVLKSQLVHTISAIDERFQKLSYLMKVWAKANGINSSKDRTLNSLSLISLVAFHLQTRNPPILPPFSRLFEDGTELATVKKKVNDFLNFGKENKESVGLLFTTLLIKLTSVKNLWLKGLCASIYQGSWISKTFDSQCGFVNVEDFTERSENVSRAVGKQEIQRINDRISCSIRSIISFLDGTLPRSQLKQLLFCPENVHEATKDEAAPNGESHNLVPHSSANDPSLRVKKRQLTGYKGGKEAVNLGEAQGRQIKRWRSDSWKDRKSQVNQYGSNSWRGWGNNYDSKTYQKSYSSASNLNPVPSQFRAPSWDEQIARSNYEPSSTNQVGVAELFNPSMWQRGQQQQIFVSPSVAACPRVNLVNPSAAAWPTWPGQGAYSSHKQCPRTRPCPCRMVSSCHHNRK